MKVERADRSGGYTEVSPAKIPFLGVMRTDRQPNHLIRGVMKWLKPLLNRYLIGIIVVAFATFLLLGQPVVPSPCFQNRSLPADIKSIEAASRRAERVLPNYFFLFKEEPLWDFKRQIDEGYRLIYTPAFRPNRLVSIWKAGNEQFISIKQARQIQRREGKEILISYELETDKQLALNLSDWQTFKRLAEVTCYWGMNQEGWSDGKDGESFMLEGLQKKRYHLVHRWLPMKISYYRRLCDYLFKLAERYS